MMVTLLATAACAPTHNYVIKNVPHQVALEDSACHAFEYVNVKEEDGQLRVYGKIEHSHPACHDEGHVEFVVLRPSGHRTYSASLPLRPQSHRVYGWAGAAFRAVLPYQLTDGDSVRLAFHDDGCSSSDRPAGRRSEWRKEWGGTRPP